jgi:hypothetical protein
VQQLASVLPSKIFCTPERFRLPAKFSGIDQLVDSGGKGLNENNQSIINLGSQNSGIERTKKKPPS